MCYITLIAPLSQGWQEVSGAGVPGCPRQAAQQGGSEAAGAAAITTGHTRGGRWVGVEGGGAVPKDKTTVFRGGHANSSGMIDFTCQPVPTRPRISCQISVSPFHAFRGERGLASPPPRPHSMGGLQEHHFGKGLAPTAARRHGFSNRV